MMLSSEVSQATKRLSEPRPRRSARILSCVALSSPDAYRMVFVFMASRFWSTRVDLPTPGSPPMSTMAPGTSPPPSTRLSSPEGSLMRGCSSARISLRATASALRPATGDGERRGADAATRSSTSVFHAPHDGQRPAHLGESAPHSLQYHSVLYLVFAISELREGDGAGRGDVERLRGSAARRIWRDEEPPAHGGLYGRRDAAALVAEHEHSGAR